MNEFRQFLNKEKINISDQDLQSNLDYIKTRIRVQLVGSIFGEDEADKISIDHDPLVQKALTELPQAKELLANAKRYMASKDQK